MSAALNVIRELERLGGSLVLDGDAIRYRVPRDKPEAQALLAQLRAHREDAIRILRERTGASCGSPDCAGCYEIEPGRRIHPPKPSREWLEWLEQWQPKGPAQ